MSFTGSLAAFVSPLVAAIAILAGASGMPEAGERLVLTGQDGPELDACAGYGKVSGLKPSGDGTLNVRIAPGPAARIKDRITNGTELTLCDQSGQWLGVVYTKPGDSEQSCGTSSPALFVGAYRGPCRFGWVHTDYVEFLAG